MKFRPPRDGSGDRRGNDAAYRLLLARQQRSRGGEGRKVGRKIEVGKKKKEERGNGRKIKAEEEEKKRAPCRVFEEGLKREESISRWRRGTGGGGARGSCRRGLVRRRASGVSTVVVVVWVVEEVGGGWWWWW